MTHRNHTPFPDKIADCARKRSSQTLSFLKGQRLPKVLVLFACASIPLFFLQVSQDPFHHSRYLQVRQEDGMELYNLKNGVPFASSSSDKKGAVEDDENGRVVSLKGKSERYDDQAAIVKAVTTATEKSNLSTLQLGDVKSIKAKGQGKNSSKVSGLRAPSSSNKTESTTTVKLERSNHKVTAVTSNVSKATKESVTATTKINIKPVKRRSEMSSEASTLRSPSSNNNAKSTKVRAAKATPLPRTSSGSKIATELELLPMNQSMRACIFVRNDNHLLAEWVAYHYTVLPLRHLIIGLDENATDDPNDVLRQWKGTGLSYEVWQSQNYTQNITYDYEHPLHRFRRRQPHFLGRCMQHFHNQGNLGWLALVDTDEFIKLNPLDDTLNKEIYHGDSPHTPFEPNPRIVQEATRYMINNETLLDRIAARKMLRQRLGLDQSEKNKTATNTKIPTVLEILEEYSSQHGTLPCHSMSRLRYSAVMDNLTSLVDKLCHPHLDPNVASALKDTTQKLSTIRFLYHAAPDHWKHNEWAKVLVDLRRISFDSLGKVSNPHQPLRECKGAYIPDLASFIHVNHYINDLHVFAGRKGDTRPRKAADWEKMAFLREGMRCDQMHGWLNEFVQRFGVEQVKHMLASTLQ